MKQQSNEHMVKVAEAWRWILERCTHFETDYGAHNLYHCNWHGCPQYAPYLSEITHKPDCPIGILSTALRAAPAATTNETVMRLAEVLEQAFDIGHNTFSNRTEAWSWEEVATEEIAAVIASALSAAPATEQAPVAAPAPAAWSRDAMTRPDDDEAEEKYPRAERRANMKWLADHEGEYLGQWLALRNGELIASAPTLHEVLEKIGGDTRRTLLTTGF